MAALPLLLARTGYALALSLSLALAACGSGGETDDFSGPRVIETNPAPEATGVPLSGPIEATLSGGIDPATVNDNTFIVTGAPGASGVAGEVTFQNRKAIFTPSAPLADGATYHAVLTTGIKDLDGVPLSDNYIWSFKTGAGGGGGGGGPDQTPPEVVSTTPRRGATNVATDATVRVVFSESIRPETLRVETFFIQGVPGEIRYDDATRSATLKPQAPLAPQTRYQVMVTTAITDPAGNPLAAAESWSFTTASGPDLSIPSVISTTPNDSETGVPVNTPISAVFSEAIDPQSLQSNFTLQGPGGSGVAAAVSYDSGSLTASLTPTAALQPGTVYQATLRRGIIDLSGNPLPSEVRWSFTTASDDQNPPEGDRTRPTIINRAPTGEDIPLDSLITVRFSEAIRPDTLVRNFIITSRGRAISSEIGYNAASQTATLIPSRLRHGTTYTVILTHDVRDLAGNRLEHTSWTFRTADRPDDDDD